MKKKNRIMILLLTAILTLTSVFPMQVAAASGKTPGKVTLSSVSTSAYNTVTMKWKKTSNATNYMVYYREAGKKSWTKLATLSSTKTGYTHKASKKYPISVGKKYNYTVRGYNSKSKKYGSYNTKGLTVQTKPDTVKVSKVTVNKDSSVTVSWKAVGGADRYVIMRKTPGSSWKKIKTGSSTKKAGTPMSFRDKAAKAGVKNSYTVRSYNSKAKVYGNYSTKGVTTKTAVPEKPAATEPKPTEPKPTEPKPTQPEPTEPIKPTEPTTPTEPAKPTEPSEPSEPSTPDKAPETQEFIAEVVSLVNIERAKAGLSPLKADPLLNTLAAIRADEQEILYSHTRPDGRSCFSILRDAGAAYMAAAENIAYGQKTPAEVMNSWMNSKGHRENILTPEYGKIGVGYHVAPNGTKYWVQIFTD